MGIFKKKPAEAAAAQASPDMQDFMRREMDKIFGQRGPAHLVALIPDPGVAEPGRVTWTAIPSWDPAHMVAEGITRRPRRAGTRVSRTGTRRCQIGCLFVSAISSRPACAAMVVWHDCSSAQLGIAIGSNWATWELECDRPPVPDVSDERIWQTP